VNLGGVGRPANWTLVQYRRIAQET
jgi:hypothetical protein